MGVNDGARSFDGTFTAPPDARFAIVAARFNGSVVEGLLGGAREALRKHGVPDAQVSVTRVPGAWEIPLACKWLCGKGEVDVVIALGAVIRGGTPHFEYVAGAAAQGCMQASMESGVPVIFGVLTTDDLEQAVARAGARESNKGWDEGLAALEMLMLGRTLGEAGA